MPNFHQNRRVVLANPPRGASFVGPLDDYTTNLAGAWSVARRLLSSYKGSLIRIRRSSDNAEQDIGFDGAGNLDTAAITSFVASDSAYVTKIYDQSVNGYNASQATASAQPRIVNTGTIESLASLPCAKFNGTNNVMDLATLTVADIRQYSAIIQSTAATWNDYGSILDLSGNDAAATRLGIMLAGTTQFYTIPVVPSVRKNGAGLTSPAFNMTTINAPMVLGVDTAVPTSNTTQGTCLGTVAKQYWLGYLMLETVAWTSVASRSGFEADQKSFIGL